MSCRECNVDNLLDIIDTHERIISRLVGLIGLSWTVGNASTEKAAATKELEGLQTRLNSTVCTHEKKRSKTA